MTEERIESEDLEILVEEITKEIIKRISTGELDIDLSLGYNCTGKGYTCGSEGKGSYTCKTDKEHSCPGIFACANIHNW